MSKNVLAIILCAGKGTRMNDDSTSKVCFEVAGIPAVRRIISGFRKAGVEKFVLVVGHHAQKVMECLSGEPGIVYAFQSDQRGTGNAALCGLNAAKEMGYSGDVIVSAGDKIIDPGIIRELLNKKDAVGLSMVFGAQARHLNPNGGRVVIRNGRVYGIVEQPDSAWLSLAKLEDRNEVSCFKALRTFGLNDKKIPKVLQRIKQNPSVPPYIELNGHKFTDDEIESTGFINGSLYCFNINDALEAASSIVSDNIQGEFYLTDILDFFVRKNSVDILPITREEQMLTYSTMEELKQLDRFFVFKDLKKASQWLTEIDGMNLADVYGTDEAFIRNRRNALKSLIIAYIKRFSDDDILISRSPGRVNLMGRHVEHRGGCTNMMTTERETLMVISPRHDDLVCISNLDPRFREFSFSIGRCMKLSEEKSSWLDFIESPRVLESVDEFKGEWVNYVKSAILRFQFEFQDTPLVGMNIVMTGDIPMAAGLSSSSSILVAVSEGIVALNHLNVDQSRFVDLCGEGEWFVGTRGGAGDHAAMKCSRRGYITHMNFKPFGVGESVKFSSDYRIVVANSFISSKKSEGSKDKFNQKVASYEFGLMLIKKLCPQYADRLEFLRDINRIGLTDIEIYEMLHSIPEKVTTEELIELLPEQKEQIQHIQKSHKVPEYYEVRSVMLYGISECLRSEKVIDVLRDGDYEKLGRMMSISHNGDRVFKGSAPYDYSASDEKLEALIANLRMDRNIEQSLVINQGGGYACSTKEIDGLVDLACSCSGVLGAQIAGAGLGGCIIILVRSEDADNLIETLDKEYYDANGYPHGAQVYSPSSGSSFFS